MCILIKYIMKRQFSTHPFLIISYHDELYFLGLCVSYSHDYFCLIVFFEFQRQKQSSRLMSLTIEDHASSNGCWVTYSLGHGREASGVSVHHQANVFGFQLTSRMTKPHIVPQDDHVSLTFI